MTEYVQRYAIRATETEHTVTLPDPATSAPIEVTNRPDDEKRSVTVLGAGEPVILEAAERAAFRPITIGENKFEWLCDDTAVWPPSFAEDTT
jgi:hypothetical protein